MNITQLRQKLKEDPTLLHNEWETLTHDERMEAALPVTNGGLYNLRLARLLKQFLQWEYRHDMYGDTLYEEPTTIALQKEIEDYKGEKKWITKYSKVRLKDLCWNKLWDQTYEHMTQGSKFKRVVYCVQKFPNSLEEMKKLLGWDFTMEGPANETY